MKKVFAIVVAVFCLALMFTASACTGNWIDSATDFVDETKSLVGLEVEEDTVAAMEPTEGLEYLNARITYIVTGIGSASGDVVIPNMVDNIPVVRIDDSAFADCDNLTSIAIPKTVVNIGERAFSGCNSLKTITVSERNPKYCSVNNCIIEKSTGTVIAGCNTSVIPDDGSVTSIGAYAFENMAYITKFALPISIEEIGEKAFYGCEQLVEVINLTCLDLVTGLADNGYVAYYAKNICRSFEASKVVDENGFVTYVNDSEKIAVLYTGTNTTVTVPDDITEIYSNAFKNCTQVKSVTLPNTVTQIGKNAFNGCSGLMQINLPKYLQTIGNFAFSGCENLQTIELPLSLTELAGGLFYGCKTLSVVEIPLHATAIGEWAFRNCEALVEISIPESVTSIGRYAFIGCTKLESLEFESTENWYKLDAQYDSYASWQAKTDGVAVGREELSDALVNATNFKSDNGAFDFYWYKK